MREHLYRALTTPQGIALTTDDPQRLIQRLNAERRKANDPNLKSIVIATSRSNPTGEVWLVRKPEEPAVAEATTQAGEAGDAEAVRGG